MIKTNIKMRVTPEQSKKVQEICFENGINYRGNEANKERIEADFLYVKMDILTYGLYEDVFKSAEYQEIDADLFIKTNGTCEEIDYKEETLKSKGYTNKPYQCRCAIIPIIDEDYLTKYTSQPKDLESALKKIENLHIALNKKVDKNKNQALEITKLLEQKKDLQEEIKRMLKHEQTLIDDLYKSQCKESDKFEEIKKLNTIISYLESKLK